ncbi:MAG: hypothetical protein KI792_04810 [Alphaproteobacteria bacterium]|nr:hypothetical protein [Alphaproteobacteria bacterium SS10]
MSGWTIQASDVLPRQGNPAGVPPVRAKRSVRNPLRHLAWPVTGLMLLLLMPPETSVSFGGLRLSPYRILIIFGLFTALIRLFSGRCGKLIITDWLVAGHAVWVGLSLMNFGGVAVMIESGGVYGLEAVGAYLIARCYIRNADDYEAMLKLHLLIVIGLAIVTIPEAITGKHFIRELARSVFGGPPIPVIDPRLGLDRAFGPFDHPILLGVFCSTALAGPYMVLGRSRISFRNGIRASVIGIATFMSLSAGPLIAYASQAGFIGWERVTRVFKGRWYILLLGFAFAYIAVDLLATRNPIIVFVQHLTFSAQNAYTRVLIWNYGVAEVARFPWFGIGLGDWARAAWMGPSVDNFWLLTAMRYGLPAVGMLVGATLATMLMMCRRPIADERTRNCRLAWCMTIISLIIVGLTVHFWNALFAWFFFLIGSGAWMAGLPTKQATSPRSLGGER